MSKVKQIYAVEVQFRGDRLEVNRFDSKSMAKKNVRALNKINTRVGATAKMRKL